MVKSGSIKLFEERQVRSVWDEQQQKWFISIVDVIGVLTESNNPRRYWSDLKTKLQYEGSELYEKIVQLKMLSADGKSYKTDAADVEQLFRLIQSIPSPKAEPFKMWLAEIARERLEEIDDPELGIDRMLEYYHRKGYSQNWINQRLKSIEVRKELTDEWEARGVKKGQEFASLTDIITLGWAGMTTGQYKRFKGLKTESLRDNMTNLELALNTLAEATTTELSKEHKHQSLFKNITFPLSRLSLPLFPPASLAIGTAMPRSAGEKNRQANRHKINSIIFLNRLSNSRSQSENCSERRKNSWQHKKRDRIKNGAKYYIAC